MRLATEDTKSQLNMLKAVYKATGAERKRLSKKPFNTLVGMRKVLNAYESYFGEKPSDKTFGDLYDTVAILNAYQLYHGDYRLI